MFQLAYTSTAVRKMDPDELAQILREARTRNTEHGVTGMLLYRDGSFLQVLEGDEGDVRRIYGLIEDDDRHTGLIEIISQPTEDRDFPDWRMGFRNLDDIDEDDLPEGYSRFMDGDTPEHFQDASGSLMNALLHFRQISEYSGPTNASKR